MDYPILLVPVDAYGSRRITLWADSCLRRNDVGRIPQFGLRQPPLLKLRWSERLRPAGKSDNDDVNEDLLVVLTQLINVDIRDIFFGNDFLLFLEEQVKSVIKPPANNIV